MSVDGFRSTTKLHRVLKNNYFLKTFQLYQQSKQLKLILKKNPIIVSYREILTKSTLCFISNMISFMEIRVRRHEVISYHFFLTFVHRRNVKGSMRGRSID